MSFIKKFGISISMMGVTLWLCVPGSLSAQTFTTLLSFDQTNGGNPAAALIEAKDGNFYGTTSTNGANEAGTVFRITPNGSLTTLHNFCSQTGCLDGSEPEAGLIQASDGNFYGTTEIGTGTTKYGTVFKITPAGTLTTLHTFSNTDGSQPVAALVQGTDGNLYGTASRGGANTCTERSTYNLSCGTFFKITLGGVFTSLASFDQTTGYLPSSPLIQGSDGNFYGTTPWGGTSNFGTVFKISKTGTVTVLHNFDATDGEKSFGALVRGRDGNFYGTTSFGGSNPNSGGTVFKITPGGTPTTLHSFGISDGSGPDAALIQANDGNFYGTTSNAGTTNTGTVFKITRSGKLITLHTFNGTDGELPYAALVQGTNGEFYGATKFGASSACTEGCGTIFNLSVGLAPLR
jgi:uncharacterized repeat protein (TIGR03803 family)